MREEVEHPNFRWMNLTIHDICIDDYELVVLVGSGRFDPVPLQATGAAAECRQPSLRCSEALWGVRVARTKHRAAAGGYVKCHEQTEQTD